jgi:ribosomal protein S18 acetylase RimI-like enzyme
MARLIELTPDDTERIVSLEARSFIPPLQATAEMLRRRFQLGHMMFGLEDGAELVGMIASAYSYFDPCDRRTFPDTECEFCMLPKVDRYNAVYMYNFEVAPGSRGHDYPRMLLLAALTRGNQDGCKYGVACPRIPSYRGSKSYPQESVEHRPQIQRAIDQHLQGGDYPDLRDMLNDPLLALYYRLGRPWHAKFHWVIPNFAPYDHASGGIRVLLYGDFSTWNPDSIPPENQK